MATAVYGTQQSHSTTTTVVADISVRNGHQPDEQHYFSTFFCRALYDYQSTDDASLSFRRGDIIEVLTRLETGWWDGLLGDERGWFPSNYVVTISDEEADAALSASDYSQGLQQPALVDTSAIAASQSTSIPPSMSSSSTSRSQLRMYGDGNWLDAETDFDSSREGLNELASAAMDNPTPSSDFWMPQVSADGQIFYVNTQTGQRSRDLPTETEDDLSESDFSSVTVQQRTRSGSSVALAQPNGMRQTSNGSAGFGLPRRSNTPEPWARRLADDGMSYYYFNKLDGSVQWTLPEASSSTASSRINGQSRGISQASAVDGIRRQEAGSVSNRLRSDSAVSDVRRGRSGSEAGHASVYSDDSDVDPLDRRPYPDASNANGARNTETRLDLSRSRSALQPQDLGELTSAEKSAHILQQALAPPPPASVTELSGAARQAVAAVVDFIQAHGVLGRLPQQNELDTHIVAAVVAIRNLLLVSSPPYGHISSSLYPKGGPNPKTNAFIQTFQAQLKPAQRKVTATLSKLVLAALAAQYDSSTSTDTPTRMEADAAELDRALVTFVMEVQRSNSQAAMQPARVRPTHKRLRAAFSPIHVGLGLIGAGAAGSWKGFGWVAPAETDESPQRVLANDVLIELKASVSQVDGKLIALGSTLANPDAVAQIEANGLVVVSWIHAFLVLVSNVSIARAVDIDGINREGANEDAYMKTVQRAQVLVRTLEAATQSIYDDGALLLLTVQTYASAHHNASTAKADLLVSVIGTLKTNASLVMQTLDTLLKLGQEQQEMAKSDYTGSIDWRMSRISMINSNLGRTLREVSELPAALYDAEEEDVVGLDFALRKPAAKSSSTDRSQAPSTMYSSPSHTSESSLETPGRQRAGSVTTGQSWSLHKAASSMSSLIGPTAEVAEDDASLHDDEDVESAAASLAKSPSRADKLVKIFGERPKHIIDTINAEAKPWYLRPTYSQTEILIDPDGKVRAGTVPALVERLTAHEHSDTSFSKTFLLTYKSFTDLDTLFDLLVQRFWIEPPDNLKPEELDEWTKLKQHVIRTRVLNTFKTMILDSGFLEKEDMHVLDRMKEMVSGEGVIHLAAAKQLLVLIERAQKGDSVQAKTTISLDPQPPPIIPKPSKKQKLVEFDPLEVARQLTIVESYLYQKIKASECLVRSREQKPGENNDNIATVIETTNKIAHWVADTVLSKEDSRKRAVIVKQFINVADRCRNLLNFSSMIAIVSGLNSPPIRRLKRTWEQINQRSMTLLGACEMTIDSNKNFGNYRSLLARITPPCVPFIGRAPNNVSGPNSTSPPNLVNFRKRQMAAEVIDEIKKWQSKPFNFAKVDVIYDYVQDSLKKFNDVPDVSDLFWNLSLEREPREREDEKMARLLQETGFL
ncbi:hypothetical protein EW146_g5099 [Bondarzewia mesenterica]|uniref:Ras GEF n=1 Tax=Bondarzewia mesenterica TaxID=1095465 RepID=A0A4S4LSF9_9AGAM|nr:hypothetical protein EW146_g5099 [Bondarzewia mesenterica]